MIKPYIYTDHAVQQLHVDVTDSLLYILDNNISTYDRNILQGKLKDVFKKKATKLEKYLKEITEEFGKLNDTQKVFMKEAIENNNHIESLCNNSVQPTLYDNIETRVSESIKILLHNFSYFLWDEVFKYDGVIELYGTILDHHEEFKNQQKIKVCPLCGIDPLKPPGRKVREAYDHYLPKSYYPFNSINLYNLVPTCGYCNSDEKSDGNILSDNGQNRRTAFFPFSSDDYTIEVTFRATGNMNELSLSKVVWHPEFTCNSNEDQRIESWRDIYKIDERYIEYSKFNESTWKGAILDKYQDSRSKGESFEDFKKGYLKQFKSQLMRSLDILEKAYAEYFLNKPNIEQVLQRHI